MIPAGDPTGKAHYSDPISNVSHHDDGSEVVPSGFPTPVQSTPTASLAAQEGLVLSARSEPLTVEPTTATTPHQSYEGENWV